MVSNSPFAESEGCGFAEPDAGTVARSTELGKALYQTLKTHPAAEDPRVALLACMNLALSVLRLQLPLIDTGGEHPHDFLRQFWMQSFDDAGIGNPT
jgi:hypothetical protein